MVLIAVAVFIILTLSFFCSTSEASLLSVSRVRIHALAEHDPSARLVERMKDTIDRPIAAILVLNTVANSAGAALVGREWERVYGGAHIAAFTAIFTTAILVVGELLPKTLGARHSLKIALLTARPLWIAIKLIAPLVWLVERMGKLLGGSSKGGHVSVDDIRAITRLAVSAKVLGREEQMIIETASRLPRIQVTQIMIHREDMVWIALEGPTQENLAAAKRSMHSRLLLCRNNLEDLVGVVNVKDVLWRLVEDPTTKTDAGLRSLLEEVGREPLYVNDDIDVSQLLRQFSEHHEHLAIVRDANGRVVGMVTLEDVVEELLGEVDDEYDVSPERIERLDVGAWRFGGGTSWDEAATRLGLPESEFKAEDMDLDGRIDVNDVAGNRLRGKLRTGGVFTIGKWRFKVLRMRRGKVLTVEVALIGQPTTTIADARRGDTTLS